MPIIQGSISIIVTHWAQNAFRSETLRRCMQSLIATTLSAPCEILVVDNGENWDDSMYLLSLAQDKKIEFYLRNARNMHFGHARNQAILLSSGENLVISDNDIEYQQGWVEACLEVLTEYPLKKYLATPLSVDRIHRQPQYWKGEIETKSKNWFLNMRAGSNSFMVRRKDFEEIGWFRRHRIAGSHWNNAFQDLGYIVASPDTAPLAQDIGFKQGYNHKQDVPIEKIFTNGSRVGINS